MPGAGAPGLVVAGDDPVPGSRSDQRSVRLHGARVPAGGGRVVICRAGLARVHHATWGRGRPVGRRLPADRGPARRRSREDRHGAVLPAGVAPSRSVTWWLAVARCASAWCGAAALSRGAVDGAEPLVAEGARGHVGQRRRSRRRCSGARIASITLSSIPWATNPVACSGGAAGAADQLVDLAHAAAGLGADRRVVAGREAVHHHQQQVPVGEQLGVGRPSRAQSSSSSGSNGCSSSTCAGRRPGCGRWPARTRRGTGRAWCRTSGRRRAARRRPRGPRRRCWCRRTRCGRTRGWRRRAPARGARRRSSGGSVRTSRRPWLTCYQSIT